MYFEITKYTDTLYQFKDKLGVLSTLVIGSQKALLFDTAYGIGDLLGTVRTITDKPLIVVNSHGHMDHTCGNYQFDEVWIDKNDLSLCQKHNSYEWRKKNLDNALRMNVVPGNLDKDKYLCESAGNLKTIDCNYFDLGDEKLEIIKVPGHTLGSIALYSRKRKLMLVSDATCPFVWLFLEESTTVSKYIESIEKLLSYDFDAFLVGHGARLFPKDKMQAFLDCAKTIDLSKAVKVSFAGFENTNSYCYTLGKMYDQNDVGIVFDPNKL